jgi:hypothetical protein
MSADHWIAIAAGLISGGAGALAAIFAYAHGYVNIEKIERRRQKVDLTKELMASRYALVDGYVASDADVRDINRALALIPFAFSQDRSVVAAYDNFVLSKSNDNLFLLLEKAIEAAGLKQYELSRGNIAKVISVNRPVGQLPVYQIKTSVQSSPQDRSKPTV